MWVDPHNGNRWNKRESILENGHVIDVVEQTTSNSPFAKQKNITEMASCPAFGQRPDTPEIYRSGQAATTPSDAQWRPATPSEYVGPDTSRIRNISCPIHQTPKRSLKIATIRPDSFANLFRQIKSTGCDRLFHVPNNNKKKKFQKRTLYSTGANSTEPNRLFGVPMDQNHQIGFQIGFSSSDSPWRKCQRIELGIFRTAFENPPNCVDKNNCAKWADPKCCVNIWLNKKLKIKANRLVDCTKIRPNCIMNRID